MFRIVVWGGNTRYVRRTLRGEGKFVNMPYEQRKYILFFVPSMENENEVASLLVNLVDRGYVLKFVYWNERAMGSTQAEEELEAMNERNIASGGTDSGSLPNNRAE